MKTILVDAWNTFVTQDGTNKELQNILDQFPNKKIILTNANKEEKIKYGIVNMPYEVFCFGHNYFLVTLFNHHFFTKDIVRVDSTKAKAGTIALINGSGK